MKKKCSTCNPKSVSLDKKQKKKMTKVMREFAEDELHEGSKKGPKVRKRKQALAIGFSEAKPLRK